MKQRFSKRTRLVSALLTLAMVFTFLPFSAFAEAQTYVPLYKFPDETFRKYLEQFDKDDDTFLSTVEREAVKEINVKNKNISNLYGIQFFPNLKMLDCDSNNLTSLDVSKNTALQGLYCDSNQLTSLDVSQNTALVTLSCSQNRLTSLNVRQNTELVHLYCNDNKLTSLDVSQNPELWILNCSINQLTELDVSQNPELEFMYCNDNNLTSLDVSRNNKIFVLDANNNYLTNLNVENTSIDIFNSSSKFVAKNNTYPITVGSDRTFDLSTLPGTFDVTKATKWNGGTVSGNTLTVNAGATKVTYLYDCGKRSSKTFTLNVTVVPEGSIGINASNFPDPNFRAYVKAEFDKDYNNCLSESERNAVKEIDVSGKNISNLYGIQFFPNLKVLYCYNNQLTELDVSKNTQLQTLYCYENQLTKLDVRQNTALVDLYCYQNQLTELDVRQNAALKYLSCIENQLTSLDVRQNAALTYLDCGKNQLTSLDVRKNAALKYLYCYQNYLTSLDVSQNPALLLLSCNGNQLTSLDLSQTAVTALGVSDNKITIKVEETSRTFDLSTLPGFDVTKASGWKGGTVNGSILTVNEDANQVTYTYDCGKDWSKTFTLNVNIVPDGTVTPPSGGGSTGGGSTGGGDGGAGIAVLAVGGAAVAGLVGYGVYNYVSGQKLQALLPEGVAAPENRAQTALLLWNTAGRPEPAEAPAFADVADPDTAKAAQWCVEQGLMKRRLNGKFAPGSSIPAYQVLNAYRKLAG